MKIALITLLKYENSDLLLLRHLCLHVSLWDDQTSELGVTEHIEGDPCKFALWVGRTPTSDNKTVLKVGALRSGIFPPLTHHAQRLNPPPPPCKGVIVGAEAGVGPQHSPGDSGEAGPSAGCTQGAHPSAQDAKPHPGAAAQHQPQVSRNS